VRNRVKAINGTIQFTCSSSSYKFNSSAEHNSWFGGLGLDYYEFHSYSDAPNLAIRPSYVDKPFLLGEYGPSLPAPNYTGQNWTETQVKNAVDSHVTQARDRGYAGSMAWMYFNSPNNGENYVITPGGNQAYKQQAWTLQYYGNLFLNPVGPVTIYSDSLASDWQDWSWFPGPANIADTTRAQSGYSALSVRKGTALNTSGYSKIRFYIYTPTSNRNFAVVTQTGDSTGSSSPYSFSSTANAWKLVDVPLSALGSPSTIKRVNIQNSSGSGIGNHWVDSIELLP
jgi:hypothetical protein